MTPEIGVLVVHGMGTQDENFWRGFAEDIDSRLEKQGIGRGTVAWEGGYWADLLNDSEETLWRRELKGGPLDYHDLRRFVVTVLGDAVAYRRTPAGGRDVYVEVHQRILDRLRALRHALGGDRPILVIAHSLGSVIISDYIWNAQHHHVRAIGTNDLERMRTLAGLVTFGSGIPLFSLALPRIEAITFPPKELPEPLRQVAQWHNYYDKDDVLGWPLKTISPSYAEAVTADHQIDVGNLLRDWNPTSHTEYWGDRDFLEPVASQIGAVVAAARLVAGNARSTAAGG